MSEVVSKTKAAIQELTRSLPRESYALIPTSRGLLALADARFEQDILKHNWFAVISRGDHMYAVADIQGHRVSMQRFVLSLAHEGKSAEDFKQVSFENKLSFDCRRSNLVNRVGRTQVMRNRLPKKNTSSKFKGVIRVLRTNGDVYWRAQIHGELGTMSLGSYDEEKEAALVYDAAAFLMFKGGGYYNFPALCPDLEATKIATLRISRFEYKMRWKREDMAKKDGLDPNSF